MATPNVGILTTAGKALIDKVNSGQSKISFSKIVFSSMDNSQLSDMQVKALTAIAPQEVVVSSPETTLDTNSGETRIRATGTNEKLADGVYVKTYGVFAKDDKGSEILYGVTVSPNPNYFPAYDGVTPQAVTYSYKTVIQETSNITMTNSNDVYASQEDLTEALQPYAKTVDVNQQLDKKVNIADMRKPASNVAGIEEVNAKQDKIGYTPADDSKVVHDNHDGRISVNGASILPANENVIGRIDGTYTDMNDIPMGWLYLNGWASGLSGLSNWGLPQDFYYVHCFKSEYGIHTNIQIAYGIQLNSTYVRTMSDTKWTTWKLLADDSKVAHLSGANNFDTVPTVKNNPLLLASSLPSDLARTTKDANFTGKLQKSGIDVATKSDVTNAVSTATANMVDSTKATNFTAGLQSGGVDVATAADLKSVEASAWRELGNNYVTLSGSDNPYATIGTWVLYRLDTINKRLYFMFTMGSNVANGATAKISFSSVVNNISDPKLPSFVNYFLQNGNLLSITVSGNSLSFTISNSFYACSMYSQYGNTNNLQYDMCFVNYDKLV